jgi:DmsE family decaheme c-type cytochrome
MRDRSLYSAVRDGLVPFVLGLGLALAAVPARAQVTPPPDSLAAKCADCHEDKVAAFESSVHGRTFGNDAHFSSASCANCHGDPATHLESNDPADIRNPRKLSAAESSAICLKCHRENPAQAHWMGSAHQRKGIGCVDCHQIHAAPAPDSMVGVAMKTELCYRCHKDKRAEMQKTSHHPVREGKLTCLSCHSPHGTLTKANLVASSVNELCYQCHTEKRGPFLWEHAPVRENCLNCHTPHGSNHLKLQSTSVPFLCQECHANTRHPGTLYDRSTLGDQARASNRIFNRACLDCHAAIHGSNNPSGPYLGR